MLLVGRERSLEAHRNGHYSIVAFPYDAARLTHTTTPRRRTSSARAGNAQALMRRPPSGAGRLPFPQSWAGLPQVT